MKKVRMLIDISAWKHYRGLKAGGVYDISEPDIEVFLRNKWAVPVEEETPREEPAPAEKPLTAYTAEALEEKPVTAYDKLAQLTQYHLTEIYGAYGTGKSRLVHHIAVEAQNAGKRVLFIDTEGGLADEHIRQLQNYWYIGDSIEALEDAVAWAKDHRSKYDLLVVDSVGHPVYVNYVEMESMDQKLKAYQRLAAVFRDMVRFARGERGVDFLMSERESKRKALAIATNHPVSEFAKIAKDLPPEEPLAPFGGQIHRVPKVILRCEPVELAPSRSVFRALTFKLRNMPKNVEAMRYTITKEGVSVEWKGV